MWRRGNWTSFRFVQVGSGIALLLLMLHTLVDFNLQIPANAVFASFLTALFFHRAGEDAAPPLRRNKGGSDGTQTGQPTTPLAYTIPPENQINPFTLP